MGQGAVEHGEGQATRNLEIQGEGVPRSIIRLTLRIVVLFFYKQLNVTMKNVSISKNKQNLFYC